MSVRQTYLSLKKINPHNLRVKTSSVSSIAGNGEQLNSNPKFKRMKHFTQFIFLTTLLVAVINGHAQLCNTNGNVVIFSNYDGGTLNINVDVNIPNLKIGIVSYEAVEINLSGTYVSNVVEVNYSGYNNSPNTNCSPTIATTVINGAGSATTNIQFAPTSTYTDTDGYGSIICSFQCASGVGNGGCNSATQIGEYFTSKFGGELYFHRTQYGCWSGTQSLSTGGNCCLLPAAAPVANFSVTVDEICVGECLSFTDLSTNVPTSWDWSVTGPATLSSTDQNPDFCFNTPGTYTVELTATNITGSDNYSMPITVNSVDNTVNVSGFTINANQAGATYQWLDCNNANAAITGETNQAFSPASDGSYSVIVTLNGCSDTSSCTTILGMGIELKNKSALVIYPNPSGGEINIIAPAEFENAQLDIYSIQGDLIFQSVITGSKLNLDLTHLSSGIYMLSLKTDEHVLTHRLTIE